MVVVVVWDNSSLGINRQVAAINTVDIFCSISPTGANLETLIKRWLFYSDHYREVSLYCSFTQSWNSLLLHACYIYAPPPFYIDHSNIKAAL